MSPVTAAVCGDVQGVAGAVVEPGDDLHVVAVGEPVVGEVGLPGFVRHAGFEADVGGLRALLRFGVTMPARPRWRLMVDRDTRCPW